MDPKQMMNYVQSPPKPNIACLVITKLVILALPIAQIVIGSVHLNDCTQQRYIPIYVLVSGVFSIFLGLMTCLPCSRKPEEGGSSAFNLTCSVWNGLVSTFLFCWVIAGSVWIYTIYPPNYNQTANAGIYCDKTLYLFAFWTTTVGYILLGVALIVGCCLCICSCICGVASP